MLIFLSLTIEISTSNRSYKHNIVSYELSRSARVLNLVSSRSDSANTESSFKIKFKLSILALNDSNSDLSFIMLVLLFSR